MTVRALFIKDESGQAMVESAVFIALLFILVVFAVNFSYFIGFAHTIHASSARAAVYSAQGDLTPLGSLPTSSSVTSFANQEISNTGRDSAQAAPVVTVCTGNSGGCAGFADPEAGVPNTGGFTANSVTVTQSFMPLFGNGKSIFGINLVPFSSATSVSRTVYVRSMQ